MLLGRENEFHKIYELLKSSFINTEPLSIYIGGTPGTGKTATIRLVVAKLRKSNFQFNFIPVDCFECSKAADLYRRILDQLGENSTVSSNRIAKHLENVFLKSERPIVILMDEIDRLSTSKSDLLVYKAFGWPNISNGKVITIGISNALDMVERLLPKLKANLNPPKVITYSPYSKQQLVTILHEKLSKEGIDSAAIELCARKVSALTGDVRQAFHIANGIIKSLRDDPENVENVNTEQQRVNENRISLPPLKKVNACREVLKEIDKVYASPLLRAQLPLHPRILLASFMRLISIGAPKLKGKRYNATVVLRDKLFDAYAKVCMTLSYSALTNEELGNAFAVLESQGMISQKAKGFVAFEVELEIARKIINDNAILSAIECVDL